MSENQFVELVSMDDKEFTQLISGLFNTDLTGKTKEKNGLTYASWSSVWGEVLKRDPHANYEIIEQVMDSAGNTRPWHDDGKTAWVKVKVTIGGKEAYEMLPVMNFKNQSIPADSVASTDANKAIKRCLAKAVSVCCGLGLYLYQGEDVPDETAEINEAKKAIGDLVAKKCQQGDAMKKKVGEICKEYERKAFPEYSEDEIIGDYRRIDNIDVLNELKRKLLSIRISKKKGEDE